MLNGESFQPCLPKIGPKRKGSQDTPTPESAARPSILAAAG